MSDSTGLCECGCGRPAAIAKRDRPYLGHVKGQPTRFAHGHGNALRRLGLGRWEERDMGHTTLCWVWIGAIADTGYGTTRAGATRRKVGAHRAVYEAHRGAIPEGMELDHLCRVRVCVNPSHLEIVTRAENVRRAWRYRS